MMVALLRIVELSGGSISIDGINTRSLSLAALRQRISLVAQDPVLLRGTLRYNMWPPHGAETPPSDEELLHALSHAGLQAKVRALRGGLDTLLTEGGANLSAGERQLICMARVLVRTRHEQGIGEGGHVLLMDEATASVDAESDASIQNMVRSCFDASTVITIAHRLNTVAFYDRVLVLAHSKLVEFDTPLSLLEKPGGAFRELGEGTGDLQGLIQIAKRESHESRAA